MIFIGKINTNRNCEIFRGCVWCTIFRVESRVVVCCCQLSYGKSSVTTFKQFTGDELGRNLLELFHPKLSRRNLPEDGWRNVAYNSKLQRATQPRITYTRTSARSDRKYPTILNIWIMCNVIFRKLCISMCFVWIAFTTAREVQRICITFCFINLGIRQQIQWMIYMVFRGNFLSDTQLKVWYWLFQNGREFVENYPRSGSKVETMLTELPWRCGPPWDASPG